MFYQLSIFGSWFFNAIKRLPRGVAAFLKEKVYEKVLGLFS